MISSATAMAIVASSISWTRGVPSARTDTARDPGVTDPLVLLPLSIVLRAIGFVRSPRSVSVRLALSSNPQVASQFDTRSAVSSRITIETREGLGLTVTPLDLSSRAIASPLPIYHRLTLSGSRISVGGSKAPYSAGELRVST
jgi:hypothetical protein